MDDADDDVLDSDIEIMCQNSMLANEVKQGCKLDGGKVTKQNTDSCAQYDKQRKLDAKLGIITSTTFSGNCSPTIRPMVEVQTTPLKKDGTFPDKNTLLLQIAEESSLWNSQSYCEKQSDDFACARL